MGCFICPQGPSFGGNNHTLCFSCYHEAKSLIGLLADSDRNSNKRFSDVYKMIKELKEGEENLNEKINFLSGLVVTYTEGIHTDICLQPSNGPPIAAHKALLAARSSIFKNVLASDRFKATPSGSPETVSVPEMNHAELQSLLEFLYKGSLSDDKVSQHVYSLYTAADKYEIPFLLRFCENWMLESINASNCLDVLEVSGICSDSTLKDGTLKFIVNHTKDVVFSNEYEAFAVKNPQLATQIIRALVSTQHSDQCSPPAGTGEIRDSGLGGMPAGSNRPLSIGPAPTPMFTSRNPTIGVRLY